MTIQAEDQLRSYMTTVPAIFNTSHRWQPDIKGSKRDFHLGELSGNWTCVNTRGCQLEARLKLNVKISMRNVSSGRAKPDRECIHSTRYMT